MAAELGPTGQAIWAALNGDRLDAGSQALVREMARCADTLDRLDDLAMGRREGWVSIVFDDMGEVHLTVDKILDLRRNHQLTLRALYAEVRAAKIEAKAPEGGEGAPEPPKDMLADLRAAKENRERQSG